MSTVGESGVDGIVHVINEPLGIARDSIRSFLQKSGGFS